MNQLRYWLTALLWVTITFYYATQKLRIFGRSY